MARFAELCSKIFVPPLTIVDVGAAGQIIDFGDLNPLSVIHAFEPRREASDRLAGKTGFTEFHVHNVGLASTAGRHRLYITQEPSASSLRRPNLDVAKRYVPNDSFEIAREVEVDCTTLADFAAQRSIEWIDYIKLDTQGTELEILRGAGALLDRISIIKTESEFVELYQGQATFDDMLCQLSSRGFRFVDFTDGQTRDGKRIWADAVFARRTYIDRYAGIRAAVVLLALGHIGEASWLLRDLGVEEQLAEDLVSARREEPTWLHRVRAINRQRRSEGKLAFSINRTRDLMRKLSFGILE